MTRLNPKGLLFGFWLNLAFYLPYLGSTSWRVDHIFCMFAIVLVAWSLSRQGLLVETGLKEFYFLNLAVLVWALLAAFVPPGDFRSGLRYVNSFLFFSGATSIFLLFRHLFERYWREYLFNLVAFSLLINGLALWMWFNVNDPLSLRVADLYGGATSEAYGGGSLGSVALTAGRVSSIFPNPVAFAVYDLTILAITLNPAAFAVGTLERLLYLAGLFLALAGGLASSSKTFGLTMLMYLGFWSIKELPRMFNRGRLPLTPIALAFGFAVLMKVAYEKSRFIRDWFTVIERMDVALLLKSRLGEEGYLVKSGTVNAAFEPFNFIFGRGRRADDYKWSDNGYIQVLLFGGIFFFVLFFGQVLHLMRQLWRQVGRDSAAENFFLLCFCMFFANIGVGVFMFPRATVLWVLTILVVLFAARTEPDGEAAP